MCFVWINFLILIFKKRVMTIGNQFKLVEMGLVFLTSCLLMICSYLVLLPLISFVSCVMCLIIYVRCLGNWLPLIKRPSCLLKVLLQMLEEALLVKHALERFTLLASILASLLLGVPQNFLIMPIVDMWKPSFLIGRPTNFDLLVG